MKRFFFIILLCLMGATSSAKSFTIICRYSFSTVTLMNGTSLVWMRTPVWMLGGEIGVLRPRIDVSNVKPGLTTMYMQMQDTNGRWGPIRAYMFYRMPDTSNFPIACWFDEDWDSRTVRNIGNGYLPASTDDLTPGLHRLYVRMGTGTGAQLRSHLFMKPLERDTSVMEYRYHYWFDGNDDTRVSGTMEGGLVRMNTDGLETGLHTLYVRIDNGQTVHLQSFLFMKMPVLDTTARDYTCWFDQDMAHGISGRVVDGNLLIPTEELDAGLHQLYVKIGKGSKTQLRSYLFYKRPVTAQDTVQYTYWFDEQDGNRVSGLTGEGHMLINTSALDTGSHTIYVRLGSGNTAQVEGFEFTVVPIVYTVTVASADSTMGMASGSGEYPRGSDATIMATAEYGYHFQHWSDGDTNALRVLSLTSDTALTAFFAPDTFDVSVAVADTAMGTVAVYGTSEYLGTDTAVATPYYGYHFAGWSDGDTTNPRLLTVTQDTALTALFAPNVYTITLATADAAMGGVVGSGDYAYLTVVPIEVVPEYGYQFRGWSDGNSDNPRQLVVRGDTSLTAWFDPVVFDVTVAVNDTAMGMATLAGSSEYLTIDTATATARYGYHFTGWNDGDTTNPRLVTVTGDLTLTALFAPNVYTVALASADAIMGSVTGGGEYAYLSTATVTAVASQGYQFRQWNDGNTDNPRSLVVRCDTSLTASFELQRYLLTVQSNDLARGFTQGGGTFTVLDTATAMAVTLAGNTFLGWDDGSMDNPREMHIYSDSTITALFQPMETIPDTVEVHDTTYITLTDTVTNTVYDTVVNTVYDTVTNTIYDTVVNTIHDTVDHFVYDTTFIDVPVHDTTIVTEYVHDTTTVTEYVHDTATVIEYVHDTTAVTEYVHDTTTVIEYVHDTTTVTEYVHDTTTVTEYVHDTTTVTEYVYDTTTVTEYVHDTTIVTEQVRDTLWLTQYIHDTIVIHDTIIIYDTVYVGVDEVETVNVKLYSDGGHVVVEGAEGQRVILYDAVGRKLAVKQDEYGLLRFEVPVSGAYLVKIGNLPARRIVVIR